MTNNLYTITIDGVSASAPTQAEAIAMGKAMLKELAKTQAPAPVPAPAQEKPKASRKRKNGNKQGTGGKAPEQAPAPKPEKPKPENPFKKGEDGVSKYHKDMGLDTPERVAAYKQARMKHHGIVWVEYVHSTGYKGKALSEKYGKDIDAEARKRAIAEVLAK